MKPRWSSHHERDLRALESSSVVNIEAHRVTRRALDHATGLMDRTWRVAIVAVLLASAALVLAAAALVVVLRGAM